MEASNKSGRGPGEELFDGLVRGVAVWWPAYMISEGLNHILSEVVSRGWRINISIVVPLLFVGTIFWGGERWPRLRDAFYALRYPIAMLLAVYVGYQWHAHDYANSEEARLNEAVRLACTKSQSCPNTAVEYLVGK
jgi:hypothetical protein